ncbi:unnamed protein product [Brassica rapa]|uniref:Uncharacterized protein n=1 Tax=Brassica campestris TaxID=3711 RepID=A0A3P5YUU1_BRACM|nr:unnamed protein product [Brassica rapa]VDC71536.1 unnamed protein product [Brassica rapa]
MRPAYRSSKKVKDYDKLEAEFFFSHGDYNVFGILIDSFAVLHNQQVESNGRVLSIDCKDVGAKKI